MDSPLSDELPDTDPSDFVILHDDMHEAIRRIDALEAKLTALIESHNQVGENVAWIVANTQGIFQMLSDPNLINQMMSGVLGGGFGGGQGHPGNPAA